MALRVRSHVLLQAASKSEGVISGEGGFRGFLQRLGARLSTGKILRLDVADDVLRKPVAESEYRFPSPGAQPSPVVPQGPYRNVFDITYHNRDARRHLKRETVPIADAKTAGLPPTPGTPVKGIFLGMMGDFDSKTFEKSNDGVQVREFETDEQAEHAATTKASKQASKQANNETSEQTD